jgi:hypothetical protein
VIEGVWTGVITRRAATTTTTAREPRRRRGRAPRRAAVEVSAIASEQHSYGGRSREGIWYFEIPSPNTTVFSVLWPPTIALWGSLVFPYTLVVR